MDGVEVLVIFGEGDVGGNDEECVADAGLVLFFNLAIMPDERLDCTLLRSEVTNPYPLFLTLQSNLVCL